jgi:peptidoglycan/xylan/chitin deacetylase (PgdA/CDA1 family)
MVFLYLAGFVLFLLALYGPIPTFIIRTMNSRIHKRGSLNKTISLTFDDGPHPIYTAQLLDLLKEFKIPATFFVVGELAKKNPFLLKRMVAEGHSIGIHHYKHVSNWAILPFRMKKEIRETEKKIESIVSSRPIYYRPPWGHFNLFTLAYAKHLKVVMWSSITADWKVQEVGLLKKRLQKDLSDGTIYLLHDNGDTLGADQKAPESMLKALREFILEFQKQGFHCLPLKDVIGNKASH